MKNLYVPKNTTVRYENLETDTMVVKGCLVVENALRAKRILGGGIVIAGSISADEIVADELEAASVAAKRIAAKRAYAADIHASESMMISCYLESAFVQARKLTVATSQISELEADEVINLAAERKSLWRTLAASALRSLWLSLFGVRPEQDKAKTNQVMDADYVPVNAGEENKSGSAGPSGQTEPAKAEEVPSTEPPIQSAPEAGKEPYDMEKMRFLAIFDLLRDSGFTLKILPGTPEENAPVFTVTGTGDMEITRKAA